MTEPTKEQVKRARQIVNEYEEKVGHLRGYYTRTDLLTIAKRAGAAFAQAESPEPAAPVSPPHSCHITEEGRVLEPCDACAKEEYESQK